MVGIHGNRGNETTLGPTILAAPLSSTDETVKLVDTSTSKYYYLFSHDELAQHD